MSGTRTEAPKIKPAPRHWAQTVRDARRPAEPGVETSRPHRRSAHQSLGLALTIVCKPIANVGLNVRTTAREYLERRKEGTGARGLSSRRQGLWTRVEAAEPPQAAITERKSIVAVDVPHRNVPRRLDDASSERVAFGLERRDDVLQRLVLDTEAQHATAQHQSDDLAALDDGGANKP